MIDTAISIANKMLDSNRLLRQLFNDYDKKAEPYRNALKNVMASEKCNEVEAAYHIIKKADESTSIDNMAVFQMWILASAVDLNKKDNES